MLTALRISGFAIVDRVEVALGPGLNVLTGETGAGKSILLEALHLVLGGRMGADVLREGADEAVVEALFELPTGHPALARLAAAGLIEVEGGVQEAPPSGLADASRPGPGRPGTVEVLVRRTASRSGRGRAFVNGALCTLGLLERCLAGAVDVTGQHEHVALLDEATHLGLLDAFAGAARHPERASGGEESLVARYRLAHSALAAALRARDALAADEGASGRGGPTTPPSSSRSWMRPTRGRGSSRCWRRSGGSSARRRSCARPRGRRRGSATARRGAPRSRWTGGAGHHRLRRGHSRLGGPLGLLRSAAVELEEAGRELGRYAELTGGDPDWLAAVEDRAGALRALARKHGGSLEARALPARGHAGGAGRGSRGGRRPARRAGGGRSGRAGRRRCGSRESSRSIRGDAARRFAVAVERELEGLAMGRCRWRCGSFRPRAGWSSRGRRLAAHGAEGAGIPIAPTPGEPVRPLARIASGGELSRVLLAVKRVLARRDPVATYVFDEVDAGIGAAVPSRMAGSGRRPPGRQVLCVTHLPQVAAFADWHHRVEKAISGGRTHTAG